MCVSVKKCPLISTVVLQQEDSGSKPRQGFFCWASIVLLCLCRFMPTNKLYVGLMPLVTLMLSLLWPKAFLETTLQSWWSLSNAIFSVCLQEHLKEKILAKLGTWTLCGSLPNLCEVPSESRDCQHYRQFLLQEPPKAQPQGVLPSVKEKTRGQGQISTEVR